jgi:hypothetical protein
MLLSNLFHNVVDKIALMWTTLDFKTRDKRQEIAGSGRLSQTSGTFEPELKNAARESMKSHEETRKG